MKRETLMNVFFTINLCLFVTVTCFAQKPTVAYDYEKEHFNENQPLPAETYFVLTSPISIQVKTVELNIYRAKDANREKPLFTSTWKRRAGDQQQVFYLPVNYKLRGNNEYDFVISYYRGMSTEEKTSLSNAVNELLVTYVDQAFKRGEKKVQLIKNTQQTIDDLNSIVNTALVRYRNLSGYQFNGFSDLVKTKIEQIESIKVKKVDSLNRGTHRETMLAELVKLLKMETSFVNATDWVVIGDTKAIENYPTEKTRNVMTLQIGYGATYLDGGVDDLSYDTAPQLGLVLPLGNAAFASQFWSRSSIVAGFYLANFENADGFEVTGPVFGRPLYAGLGYNVFRFVRFNAGMSILENNGANLSNKVYVRPFIGVSADIKLWIDLAK